MGCGYGNREQVTIQDLYNSTKEDLKIVRNKKSEEYKIEIKDRWLRFLHHHNIDLMTEEEGSMKRVLTIYAMQVGKGLFYHGTPVTWGNVKVHIQIAAEIMMEQREWKDIRYSSLFPKVKLLPDLEHVKKYTDMHAKPHRSAIALPIPVFDEMYFEAEHMGENSTGTKQELIKKRSLVLLCLMARFVLRSQNAADKGKSSIDKRLELKHLELRGGEKGYILKEGVFHGNIEAASLAELIIPGQKNGICHERRMGIGAKQNVPVVAFLAKCLLKDGAVLNTPITDIKVEGRWMSITTDHLTATIRAFCTKKGYTPVDGDREVSTHSARASAATAMREAGVDITTAMQIGGWLSLEGILPYWKSFSTESMDELGEKIMATSYVTNPRYNFPKK